MSITERRGEAGDVAGCAGQGHVEGGRGHGFAAELLAGGIYGFLGQAAVGGQLAADNGHHSLKAVGGVVMDDMAAGDGAGRPLGDIRQRADSGVGIEHGVVGKAGGRDNAVGFTQQIVDLGLIGGEVIEIALEANIGGADQVTVIPRQDEVWPAVLGGFGVDAIAWSAGEGIDHEVGALGAADEARHRAADEFEHLIHPWPGDVDDDMRPRTVEPVIACGGEINADDAAGFDCQLVDRDAEANGCAVFPGGEHVFQDEAFGVLDLGIVVDGRPAQAIGVQAGHALQGSITGEHVVMIERLVVGEHVVTDHAHADHPGAVLRPCVDGDNQRERLDQVGRIVQEVLALAERFAHETDLTDTPDSAGRRG